MNNNCFIIKDSQEEVAVIVEAPTFDGATDTAYRANVRAVVDPQMALDLAKQLIDSAQRAMYAAERNQRNAARYRARVEQ